MSLPGYLTTVKLGGTPVALSAEPMTNTSGNIFQITDTTRRVLDRNVVPTFEDEGESPQDIPAADVLSISYIFGTVTFATSKTGPVVVKTGNYVPLTDIAGAHSYNLNHGGDVLDSTEFGLANNNGMRQRVLGLRDVSLSVDRWDQVGSQTFFDALNNRTPLFIEVKPGDGGQVARGWFVAEAENHGGDISALEAGDLTFQLDGDARASYDWGPP